MLSNFDALNSNEIAEQLSNICKNVVSKYDNKLNAYIASPWFDESALYLLNTVQTIDEILGERNNFQMYYPRNNNYSNPEDTFNANVNAIRDADIIIALISRKDVGTAWEIGYAYALKKEIYLVGYDETCFKSKTNLMLAYTGKCFTIDKLDKFLTSGLDSSEFYYPERTWEDIE